jgi:deoxyribose-phosphate aldolase
MMPGNAIRRHPIVEQRTRRLVEFAETTDLNRVEEGTDHSIGIITSSTCYQYVKEACGDRKMKVILETGCLKTASNIKTASLLAMYSGADYIKTSTGKLEPAATPEAAYVMCQAIKEYYDETGVQIGFKPAGGLNSVMDALIYYTIVKEVLGEQWLTNQWFRMGTSRLANMLLSEVTGEETKFF